MLAALIIVFREVFEAGLIIGIVLAATRGVARRGWYSAAGVVGGLAGACVMAAFVGELSAFFAGMGQEVFNACILAVAVVMLTWHNVWMSRHGREIAADMQAAGAAVVTGSRSLAGLAIVIGIAVLREGAEVVLFLYGIAASNGLSGLLVGGLIGLALGALVSALTYFGLVVIPPRRLFAVTTVLIAFLAAGMAAQVIGFLEMANILTWLDRVMWDTSMVLPEASLLGRALHALFGYSDQPTALQFVVWAATLAATFGLMRLAAPRPRPPVPAE